jgi:hypothetical protein
MNDDMNLHIDDANLPSTCGIEAVYLAVAQLNTKGLLRLRGKAVDALEAALESPSLPLRMQAADLILTHLHRNLETLVCTVDCEEEDFR